MGVLKINIVLFLLCVCVCDAAKILFVIPTPSVSHQVVFRPFYLELVKRGHNVTVITTDPVFPKGKSPGNLNEIDFHDISYSLWRKDFISSSIGNKDDFDNQLKAAVKVMLAANRIQIESEAVQNIIKNDKFDLLVIEAWLRSYLVYSHLIKAPVILMSSFGAMYSNYEAMGAPTHPLLYPTIFQQKINNLSFFEKINALYTEYRTKNLYYSYEEKETKALREVFGPGIPSVSELTNNVDMMFLNNFPAWDSNRPVPPGVIFIGGIHERPKKDLSKDLQNYLDSSKNGVVYISFGTNVKPSLLPKEKIQVLVQTFSALSYDVLWKWDQDDLPGLSSNVKLSKWFPQPDLLRHPKVKIFITQGGLQSSDEAIVAGVPLIGIPMLGDQWYNVERYVQTGIGVKIDLNELTVEILKNTIEAVINDPKYRTAMERLRTILYDQPQTALERAVWWTEYVIRHKGAKHLRSPAANMSWWEFLEMEIVLTIAAIVLSILGGSVLLLLFIIKSVGYCSTKKIKSN